MAIPQEDIEYIREQIESAVRPLFFFDDDADGLSSFLLLYRLLKEGKGVIIKTAPEMTEAYVKHVKSYSPDIIFILDKPMVSQDFLNKINTPVIWLDHHEPVKRYKVKYFNPRIHDDKDSRPTTFWAYQIADQDLWIATVGCIGDWFVPPYINKFAKKYPQLLPKKYLEKNNKKPEKILFETKTGELAKIFNFLLKGKTSDALTSVKILTRIKSPEEILEQTTSQGKYIYKRYQKINKEYQEILSGVKATKSKVLLYSYDPNKTSFTSELSNELLYKYPDKLIIIARERFDEMKCSLRASNIKVAKILKKALEDVEGYGGGHEHACGACIKTKDFEKFVNNIKELL